MPLPENPTHTPVRGGRRIAFVEARSHGVGYRRCALRRYCNLYPMRKADQYNPSNEQIQAKRIVLAPYAL